MYDTYIRHVKIFNLKFSILNRSECRKFVSQRVRSPPTVRTCERVRAHTRDCLKDNNARKETKNRVYACKRMRIMRVETWKKVRAGCACACARLFFAILTFFAFLFVLRILFSSLSSLLFYFFFFFYLFLRVCVYTRAILCALYFSSYTITRGCTRHFLLSLLLNSVTTPHVYFRRRLSSPHRHSSTYCLSLCEPKVHDIDIYIYIYFYTYVYYIYIYVCITVSAVSPMYNTASSLDLPL